MRETTPRARTAGAGNARLPISREEAVNIDQRESRDDLNPPRVGSGEHESRETIKATERAGGVNGHRKLHRSGHRKLHTWRR